MLQTQCYVILKTVVLVLGLLALSFFLLSAKEVKGGDVMTLKISSPSFSSGENIPISFTCDGRDISPALQFSGLPSAVRSLVLIVDDPDAPDPKAPKMTWVHWLLYNLPPSSSGLVENVSRTDLPPGTLEGINDWRRTGYGGPCPPIGRHRYFFKLYALDTMLPDLGLPTKDALEKAIQGHIIDQAELIGTYHRIR
jgi:Raf kinase inhibitor-like YbhB/YbcL family protein